MRAPYPACAMNVAFLPVRWQLANRPSGGHRCAGTSARIDGRNGRSPTCVHDDPEAGVRRIVRQPPGPAMSSPPAALFEMLPLHAMDELDAAEVAELERALAEALAPVAPSPAVRERLLASIVASVAPHDGFAREVAELFAVTVEGARAALARVADASAWRPLAPGVDCIRVSGSSNPAEAQCAFVRVAPGATFPWHRHLGEERSLVLHGGAHLSDGRDLRPGDLLVVDESVEHDFVIEGDEPCVFAVRSSGIALARRSP